MEITAIARFGVHPLDEIGHRFETADVVAVVHDHAAASKSSKLNRPGVWKKLVVNVRSACRMYFELDIVAQRRRRRRHRVRDIDAHADHRMSPEFRWRAAGWFRAGAR